MKGPTKVAGVSSGNIMEGIKTMNTLTKNLLLLTLLFPLQSMAFLGFFEGSKNDPLQACRGQQAYLFYMDLREPIPGSTVLRSFRQELKQLPGIYVYNVLIPQTGYDMWTMGAGTQEFFEAPVILHDSSAGGKECAGMIADMLRSHYAKNFNHDLETIHIQPANALPNLKNEPGVIRIMWHKAGHSW
ncbi:hypothetical protein D3C87_161630 [compost metagenome]